MEFSILINKEVKDLKKRLLVVFLLLVVVGGAVYLNSNQPLDEDAVTIQVHNGPPPTFSLNLRSPISFPSRLEFHTLHCVLNYDTMSDLGKGNCDAHDRLFHQILAEYHLITGASVED